VGWMPESTRVMAVYGNRRLECHPWDSARH